MCSHYQAVKTAELYLEHFGVAQPPDLGKGDMWPAYLGNCIRLAKQGKSVDANNSSNLEALNGVFGLVPHWAKDDKMAKDNYNARTETVAEKPSFKDAWERRQTCIIPAGAIFEPDWRSGRSIPTRIERADGEPLGIAGIWSSWKSPNGILHSYTMLTINADSHELMKQFHRPADEKRMVVILPEGRYQDWLHASVKDSMDFMQQYPADALQASAPPQRQANLF